jgi:hypothetical protein
VERRARIIDKLAAAMIIRGMLSDSKYLSRNESDVALAIIELCATMK